MPSIRITRFAGLVPEIDPKALMNDHAQIAHNCLLWDGWLRPMPQWNQVGTGPNGIASLYFDPNQNGGGLEPLLFSAFKNVGEPYVINTVEGLYGTTPSYYDPTFPNPIRPLGIPIPNFTNINVTVSHQNASVYPIPRTYAVTYVVGNMEGPPLVFDSIGTDGSLYEGDIVNFIFTLNLPEVTTAGVTEIRLYRTIPGFDTSEQLGNPVDTGFHLVTRLFFGSFPPATLSYSDTQSSEQIPGDLLISDQWMPPNLTPVTFQTSPFFGQTESGWAYYGISNIGQAPSYIQFSERYLHYAWPPQNMVYIPDTVTAITAFYDEIYVGTINAPYHIHIGQTDGEVLDIKVRPFPDKYQCLPNTLVATNFGAMYVSQYGLIALTNDGSNVATRRISNPGDIISISTSSFQDFRIEDTNYAAWWNGLYFGFVENAAAYVFNQPSPSNNEFPLGQLVTIDTPQNVVNSALVNGRGIFVAFGNGVWTLPLPGFGYENSTLAVYTWKSKRYVMPGLTTFAAAKVVNDGSGFVDIAFYGYNSGQEITPSFIFSRNVTHSNPFRIPHQHKCMEWEIIVIGTSVIKEIHIATSERELTEEPGE